MTVPWACVEPLADLHDIDNFCSGRDSVDTWLQNRARAAAHLIATHVCLTDSGVVCGFFALRTIVFNVAGLSSQLRRTGNENGMAPAVLLAQMGLRESDQGNGHGRALFYRAVQEVATANAAIRVPLLVVDAADEDLVRFYESMGMKRIPNTLRLAAPITKITG